jgi:DNA polymerase-4
MMMAVDRSQRTILHMDLDAFFCSVEELLDPSLAGKPFVVGGTPEGRGVVASASYPARKFGVRSAMPTAQALRLCRDLIVISGHRGDYGRHSRQVMDLLRKSAPVIEQVSIDEAYLDLGANPPLPGRQLAERLQAQIDSQFSLPSSWGVAPNKLLAKIASDVGKPHGMVVVPPGQQAAFLAPLPMRMLRGVGPKTAETLDRLNLRTIGDIAACAPRRLRAAVGDRALELIARARGQDDSPVVSEHEPKSMSAETTFARDQGETEVLEHTLLHLSEQVGRRLRSEGYAGSTVRLKLRWPDFTTITRQTRLGHLTDLDNEIYATARQLLGIVWRPGRPVRLIGVGVADLGPPIRQLELFDRSWEHDEKLLQAVDRIRQRYGPSSLKRGSDLR